MKLRPRKREIRFRVLGKYVEVDSVAVCTVSPFTDPVPWVCHERQGIWRMFFMVLVPQTLDTNSETHFLLLS